MLGIVLFVATMVFIGYFLVGKFADNEIREKLKFTKLSLVLGLIFLVMFLLYSFFVVELEAQEIGVVTTPNGVSESELYPGWNFVSPLNSVEVMDNTIWVYSFTNKQNTSEEEKPTANTLWCATKDGIKMGFDISVSWRIISSEASWVFENVSSSDGIDGKYIWLEEHVIRKAVETTMPTIVSRYTPIEAYSEKREEIQTKVRESIKTELAKTFKLNVVDIGIREVFYNKEYENAINQTKVQEQEAKRLAEVTKQKEELYKQELIAKDIAITKAQGESEALKIKGQSITNNPKIIELEWINKWNGQLPTYMMGNGASSVMLDLRK